MEEKIFKKKSKSITYKKYPNKETLIRPIKIPISVAENLNIIIEVFKNENKGNNIKMNNNVLIGVAINRYLMYLKSFTDEDEAIEELKADVINGF